MGKNVCCINFIKLVNYYSFILRCHVHSYILFPQSFADVPTWLKSLRLHKYASLFSQMTYEEMMILTEQHLESQVRTNLQFFVTIFMVLKQNK